MAPPRKRSESTPRPAAFRLQDLTIQDRSGITLAAIAVGWDGVKAGEAVFDAPAFRDADGELST